MPSTCRPSRALRLRDSVVCHEQPLGAPLRVSIGTSPCGTAHGASSTRSSQALAGKDASRIASSLSRWRTRRRRSRLGGSTMTRRNSTARSETSHPRRSCGRPLPWAPAWIYPSRNLPLAVGNPYSGWYSNGEPPPDQGCPRAQIVPRYGVLRDVERWMSFWTRWGRSPSHCYPRGCAADRSESPAVSQRHLTPTSFPGSRGPNLNQ